ncbi:3057_t:CDS:1 [Acaulospora colombiana]|uniref:3057_t:CDS:1 n=1 Tax=Acaulospora colombiana TaxID=27376 RepID=A0ACA9M8T8_9GLOM|nr:3057_t:CDS:1 [Acaulospora colombiana]
MSSGSVTFTAKIPLENENGELYESDEDTRKLSSPSLSEKIARPTITSRDTSIIPSSSASPPESKLENADSAQTRRNEFIRDYSPPPFTPEDVKDKFWDSIYNLNYDSSKTSEHYWTSSLPSMASSASSYFSYRQSDMPLRWKTRVSSASRNQFVGQSTNIKTAIGQSNIKYSYREAMDVICGEGQHSFSPYSRPGDECFDSTPNTSVTTLSHTSESFDPSILNSEEFFKLSELRVITFLQKDDLEVPEVEIWNSLIAWGIRNTPEVQFDQDVSKWSPKDFEMIARTLRNCIYWIRFHQIEPRDFAKCVLPYRPIIPPFIIGNFLRQQITGHHQLTPLLAPPRIASTLVDSSIITGRHATLLESWMKEDEPLDKNLSYRFNLLYRGSRDSISPKTFRRRCSNQGPTILIIKIFGSDQIIGGYNPMGYRETRKLVSWMKRSSKEKKKEILKKMNAFLFSFQARYYPEETAVISRVLPQHAKEAVMKHHSGPCFGAGPEENSTLSCFL